MRTLGWIALVTAIAGPSMQLFGNVIRSGATVQTGFLLGIFAMLAGAATLSKGRNVPGMIGLLLGAAGIAIPFVMAILYG